MICSLSSRFSVTEDAMKLVAILKILNAKSLSFAMLPESFIPSARPVLDHSDTVPHLDHTLLKVRSSVLDTLRGLHLSKVLSLFILIRHLLIERQTFQILQFCQLLYFLGVCKPRSTFWNKSFNICNNIRLYSGWNCHQDIKVLNKFLMFA